MDFREYIDSDFLLLLGMVTGFDKLRMNMD